MAAGQLFLELLGPGGRGRGCGCTDKGFNCGKGIFGKILLYEAGGRALWVFDKGPGFEVAGKKVCAVVLSEGFVVTVF